MTHNPKIILEREKVNVSGKDYWVYKLDSIKNAFEKYNLIIFSTEGTFDTSVYNYIEAKPADGFEAQGVATNHGGYIELGFTPDLKADGNPNIPTQAKYFLPLGERGHKIVRIPRYSITKIVVKSKRDFLLNQGKAKKLS